jgi:translation initiation factor 4A
MGVTVHCSIGGRSGRADADALRRRPDVVTGTPGRVLDNMLNKRVLDASGLQVLVLDECDEMLSEGFLDDMKLLFEHIPPTCQVVVVSATLPPDVLKITERFMKNPVRVLIPKEEITLRGIAQVCSVHLYAAPSMHSLSHRLDPRLALSTHCSRSRCCVCLQFYINCGREDSKFGVLSDLYEKLSLTQSVIFVNTRRTANMLTEELNRDGHTVSCIHSEMEQSDREVVLREFTSGASRVLVATDLLARGIDVQQISAVMNYDLPRDKANYIHRIGRGGRFGRKSVAINLITEYDAGMLGEIERYYATEVREMPDNIQDFM